VPKIAPARFEAFLRETVLLDISVWSIAAERIVTELPDPLELQYAEQSSLQSADDKRASLLATHGVRLIYPGSNTPVAILEVTMRALYQVPERMTDALFEQFRQVTLRLHTTPFAREWLRDASARMGLPPIMLPLALAHPAAVHLARISGEKTKTTKRISTSRSSK